MAGRCTRVVYRGRVVMTWKQSSKFCFTSTTKVSFGVCMAIWVETGKSPKIRRGVKTFNFGGPWIWPFPTEILQKILNLGLKSPSFPRTTFGANSPSPLAFGTFWPPLSRSPIWWVIFVLFWSTDSKAQIPSPVHVHWLSGLKNANAKRRVSWTQRTWTQALAPREASKSREIIAMRFPLGNLLPKTRVLERCVVERKREPNANASVLGTLRFRTLSALASLNVVWSVEGVASLLWKKMHCASLGVLLNRTKSCQWWLPNHGWRSPCATLQSRRPTNF